MEIPLYIDSAVEFLSEDIYNQVYFYLSKIQQYNAAELEEVLKKTFHEDLVLEPTTQGHLVTIGKYNGHTLHSGRELVSA